MDGFTFTSFSHEITSRRHASKVARLATNTPLKHMSITCKAMQGSPPDHETKVALAGVDGVGHREVVDHLPLPVLLVPALAG